MKISTVLKQMLLVTALSLAAVLVPNAVFADGITAECSVERSTGQVTIRGNIETEGYQDRVVILVLKPNVSAAKIEQLKNKTYMEQLQEIGMENIDCMKAVDADGDGNFYLTYMLRDKEIGGEYHVLLGTANIGMTAAVESFTYLSLNKEARVLEEIRSSDSKTMGDILVRENEYLMLDLNGKYAQLNKEKIHALILTHSFDSMAAFRNVFEDAVYTQAMNEAASLQDRIALLDDPQANYISNPAYINYCALLADKETVVTALSGTGFTSRENISQTLGQAVQQSLKREIVFADVVEDGQIDMLDVVKLMHLISEADVDINAEIVKITGAGISAEAALASQNTVLLEEIKPLLTADIDTSGVIDRQDAQTLFREVVQKFKAAQ